MQVGGDTAGAVALSIELAAMSTLDLRREGAVLHITLNRPESRNAMSMTMVRELGAVLAQAQMAGDTRVIVLRGAEGHFCAGADLKDMAGARMELAANPRLTQRIVQNLNRDQTLPFTDNEFDACLICVSIQYLTKPVEVMKQVGRVLRDKAPLIITFSKKVSTGALSTEKLNASRGTMDKRVV